MLSKPAHVKKKIWEQHISWMNVMREGSLNERVPTETAKQKQNPKVNVANKEDRNTSSGKDTKDE